MDFPHGVMVTVRSVTTTDDGMGDSTEVVAESEWGPCAVAPRYASESTDPRVPPVIVGKWVAGPPRELDADDRLLIDGEEYEIEGEPGNWRSPFTGWNPGLEVAAKRWGSV